MQPYIFPYLGYFQLIKASDKFVIYEDVTFIKQGWINRNNILVNGDSLLFTVPLKDVSSYKQINATLVNERNYDKWKNTFYKTIEQSYVKAPYSAEVLPIIRDVLDSNHKFVSQLASKSILRVCEYLNFNKEFGSSDIYNNNNLKSSERIIDICKKENADTYINPAGGKELYSKSIFKDNGIDLFFLKSLNTVYKQFNNDFIPSLSIIDVLMFNSPKSLNNLLEQYELI